MSDARWLQAHPGQDPVLQADHVVFLPPRPTSVAVISPTGRPCLVDHAPRAQARHYLRECDHGRAEPVDTAWVIQPDGQVFEFNIASWNEQEQTELAPGAVVWAPPRGSRWSRSSSAVLAQFLATQTYDTLVSSFELPLLTRAAPAQPLSVARSQALSANDWGVIGLMQTPTARMAPAGDVRLSFSRVYPYERYNVFVQPFDGLEAGFRYSNVLNRLYGPQELSGNQTYKDKSIDLKVRLLEESAYLPQVALGFVDAGGTGLFSGEYLVGNKRFGAFDWSLGLGWGYLGARGNIRNPFSAISPRFNTRGGMVAMGGTPNTGSFFRGPAALFGGVQYQTPWESLLLKAEYDGNHYQSEPQGNHQVQRSPFNLGLVYRHRPSVDLSLGLQRGNQLMFGLTLHTSVSNMSTPKVSDMATPKVQTVLPSTPVNMTGMAADLQAMSNWGIQRIETHGSVMRVLVESPSGAHWEERIDRMAAVLHQNAPALIDRFELVFTEQGALLSGRSVDRDTWVRQQTSRVPPSAAAPSIEAFAPVSRQADAPAQTTWQPTPAKFGLAVVPSWQQNIGGPDGFFLFRAGVSLPMRLRLSQNTAISGAVSLNLLDNYDNFKYTAPSEMPRVRTHMREYMTTSRVNIPSLQITHFGQASANQFYSMYAGYLESMYAGVGGEWLYRPWHSPFALGVDVNRVQQRSFDQLFGFGRAGSQTGYQVTTGHATAYWDTGWKSTHVRLSAGQYLAGDVGATIDLSRTFVNGVRVGVWATKTNVSARQFGEGSFDKGLYLSIPFDVMTTTRSGNTANLVYSPLTRDGGARLNRDFSLYQATSARSQQDTSHKPASAQPFGR
ncbi:YjbH domain-containing protein [Limnohabitans sp. Bal53]|uniref:YjbH domain-containing protein n=1 Tax=Limnohabitans sp. Bal53 TaxID=1977910 RepID=UPI001304A085